MNVKQYIVPETLDEAVQLLEKKSNRVVGGNHWLKQGTHSINAVSLEKLNLNYIKETEEAFIIGGATPLRDLEMQKEFIKYFPHIKEAYRHIVGVQLRNTATLGASIYSRFGFSDIVSTLLLLDTSIEINGSRILSLEEYATTKRVKEIVTKIIIKKQNRNVAYYPMRHAETDLPYFIFGLSKMDEEYRVICGARPSSPVFLRDTSKLLQKGLTEALVKEMLTEADLGSNQAATKEFREHLAISLLSKGYERIFSQDE